MARNRGSEGKIVVPGTSSGSVVQTGFDLYRIIQTVGKVTQFSVSQAAAVGDISGFESSPVAYRDFASGIKSGTLGFKCLYPSGAPAYGHRGHVSFSPGYTAHLNAFNLALAWEVLETTEFQSGAPLSDSTFEPGDMTWSGSMTGVVSDTTTQVEPGVSGTGTFRLNDETTADNTLAGTIVTENRNPVVNRQGGHQEITQAFKGSGVLTGAGDNKLFDGAIGLSDITEMVLTYNSGKTETVDGFLSALNISVVRGQLIDISGTIQLTGPHSLA